MSSAKCRTIDSKSNLKKPHKTLQLPEVKLIITGKMTSSSRSRKPYFFVATCKTVLILIQESKTDNENQTIFQIQKN